MAKRRRKRGVRGVFHERVRAFKREIVAEALTQADGNRSEAARTLGIDRAYFYYLLRSLRVLAAA